MVNERFLNGTQSNDDINVEECIVRVTKDRTVINKSSDESSSSKSDESYATNQNAFMAAVEADANKRFKERKEREKIAQGLRK